MKKNRTFEGVRENPSLTKWIRTMKLTCLLITFALVQVSAETYSQTKKLTINLKDAPLAVLFEEIEKTSEFNFFYDNSSLDLSQKVTVTVEDLNIEAVLDMLFINSDISYEIFDRYIILKSKERENIRVEFFAQQRSVSGKVIDSDGQPLPGVTVVLIGTTQGTVTNADGEYSLTNIPEGATLMFSFVGMRTKEVEVGNQTVINLEMEPDAIGIEEVVAIGYGTMKKVNLVGSISTIDSEKLSAVPTANITQSIMGRSSGLFIKNENGQPGETKTSYNIRGFGSPLLIIDGLPASDNDFKQLDPNDIQEFSVLKDAAAAAVYGARAGNGVILVTTKRGRLSDPIFTYTGNYGLQFFTIKPKFVSSEMYARMENLSLFNLGSDPIWSDEQIKKFADGSDPQYPNTNWWNETLRNYAPQMQHNININGGTEKVKYFVSSGFYNQKGLLKSDDVKYDKYTLRSNLDIALAENLELGVDISILYQEYVGSVMKLERTREMPGIMNRLFRSRPYYPAQFPDATKLPSRGGFLEPSTPIMAEIDHAGYTSWNSLTGNAKLSFSYQLPLEFKVKANYRFYRRYHKEKQFEKKTPFYSYNWDTDEYTLDGYLNDPARLYENISIRNNLDQQYYLTWDKKFKDHNFNTLAVFELLANDYNWLEASRMRYDFEIDYLFAGPHLDKDNNGAASEDGRMGFVTRINYDYKGKYLVEVNSRYDASARFPKETRWGFFPSASIAWRLSEEEFIKNNLNFISNLKIRASHGKLGFDNTGQFQFLETYSISSEFIFNESTNELEKGIRSDAIPNPYITWEKMATTNVGLDFNLWGSIIDGSADFFYRLRTDVLGSRIRSLPDIVGANMPQENYAEYDNRGVEFHLNHNNKIGNIEYSIGGNISFNREKYKVIDQNDFINEENKRRNNLIGQWTDVRWRKQTAGLFQNQDEIDNWADQDGRNNATIRVGDVKIVDYNGDGRITNDDNVIVGRGEFPKMMYGVTGSLSWKRFDFNILWQGAGWYDFDLRDSPDYQIVFYAGNTPITHMLEESYVPENQWLPTNTTRAKYPLYRTDSYNRSHPSFSSTDFWLVNGAYIRLKSVDLGYSFSNEFVNKLGIDRCRIYLSGYNLFTFSAVDYLDPEADTNTARTFGIYHPPTGTYNIGVLLQF